MDARYRGSNDDGTIGGRNSAVSRNDSTALVGLTELCDLIMQA